MKLLAFSDTYIPPDYMQQGLAPLDAMGVTIEVRHWAHETLNGLQQANLAIETGGPDAVTLPDEMMRDVDDVQIMITQFAPIGKALIQSAPKLRAIAVARTGVENIAVEIATQRGITILNTPARNARAVAECTMGLILAEMRNIARAHAHLKTGDWRRTFPNSDAIAELYGKTVGLIGFGAVGQLVAGYARAFGSKVIAYDPYFTGDPGHVTLVDLDTVMSESDVISVHARLTDETYHMIGKRELSRMKPRAIIVNTARSGLIDEQALVEALKEYPTRGAALDVFDTEPLPPDHPLAQLENVTLAPHLAGSTRDAFTNSPKLTAGHIERMLRGESALPIVNGVAWKAG